MMNLKNLLLLLLISIGCNNSNTDELEATPTSPDNDINSLMTHLDELKTESELDQVSAGIGQRYTDIQEARKVLNKSDEELKAELLMLITDQERAEFVTELSTVFDVGIHKDFFVRQISYCKYKIDMAVVGMGIMKIDALRKGELQVSKKSEKDYVKFVKEQVKQGVSVEDKNFKAIVFKGLESS